MRNSKGKAFFIKGTLLIPFFKLKILFLIFSISVLSVGANSYSQEKKLSFTFNHMTIREAIQNIEATTDYIFIYSEETVDVNRNLNVSFKNEGIESILGKMFEGTGNSFSIYNRQIIISEKEDSLKKELGPQRSVPQQTRVVKGRVTDEEDNGIPGVNVILKGTNQGTITDKKGLFEIRIRDKEDEYLIFSFIGMKRKEVRVGDKNYLDVILETDEQVIEDVVVVGAYGKKQNQMDMVGSAFQVSSKDIESLPVGRVDLLLDGIVPGVRLEPNTDAPASTRSRYNMRVRGEASLAASNEPLWIVDGTPIYTGNRTNMVAGMSLSVSPLSYLNPEDIESITVLKDASETSIYGANGANGVILVTTKQGKEGKTTINFSGRYGISAINESTRFKVLNSDEYLTLARESYQNAGLDLKYFPFQDNEMNDYSNTSTDWYDVYYDIGNSYQGNLTLSGGDEKSTFYISGSYFRQEQTVKGNTQERYSLRVNNDLQLAEKLSANIRASISYNVNDIFNPGRDYYENLPIYSVYNDDGTFRMYNRYVDGKELNGDPYWKTEKFFNSVAEREQNDHRQRTFASNSNLSLEYNIMEGLSLTSQLGIDYQSNYEDIYKARTNWSGMTLDGEPEGYSTRGHSNFFYWTNIERLNYDKNFGDHNINALLGYEMSSKEYSLVNATGSGFVNDHIKEVSYAVDSRGSSNSNIDRSMSFFVRGGYSYDRRYYLTFNVRKDGDSDFGDDVRWANFGSIAGSWNIHNESFFDFHQINILKLKASYGSNGNSRLGSRQAKGVYSYNESDNYYDQSGAAMSSSPNPGLSWETTYMTNLGLRIKLFKRIDIDAEWYNNKTVDLLSKLDVSRTTGSTRVYRNVGSIQNRGYEVSLTLHNIVTPELRWTTNLNMSHNENKLLELYNGIEKVMGTKIWREGYDLNTYYLVRWAGVDPQDGGPLWYDANGNITKQHSYDNRVPYKTSTPDLTGALVNSLNYRNLEFRFILNYVIGGYAFSSFGRGTSSDGLNIMSENQSVNQLDRWQDPGDLALAPKPIWGVSTGSVMNSTRYLYEKTNLRFQNVSLAYRLPKHIVQYLNLSSCKVSLIADNVGLWTLYDQPDRNSYRQSMSGYPMESMYSLNLDVTF